MKPFIILLAFIFVSLSAHALNPITKKTISQSEIAKIEKQVNEIIEREKVPDEKLFYLYLLGARNLRKHGLYDSAFRYYRKAFDLNVEYNQNRLQGMLELAWLYASLKKYKELTEFNQKLRKFAIGSGLFQSMKSLPCTLDYFDVIVTDKLVKDAIGKEYSYFFDTNYNNLIIDRELELQLRKGDFVEAQAMFKFKVMDQYTYYQYLLSFDLLNIINKNKHAQLMCKRRINGNLGIEVDICKMLIDYKNTGKIDLSHLPELSLRVKRKAGLEFLFSAVDALAKL